MAKERNEKTKSFYRGSFVQDGKTWKKCNHKGCPPRECEHKGWIVGAFMKPGPRETELLEIKYWEHDRKYQHQVKTSCTFECTLILCGKIKARIGGQPVTLSAGGEYDYVVIPPGVPNAIPERVLSECVRGLTFKAPSIRCAKHVRKRVRKGESFKFKVEAERQANLVPPGQLRR